VSKEEDEDEDADEALVRLDHQRKTVVSEWQRVVMPQCLSSHTVCSSLVFITHSERKCAPYGNSQETGDTSFAFKNVLQEQLMKRPV
jgi:hypothetical protein